MHVIEVPFHIGDFLSGTIHMDAEQTGAYIMLIVAHYNAGECGLPNDDAQLARIARVTPRAWKRIKPILEQKFLVNENFWEHKKCIEVLRKVQEKSNAAKANALKRHGADHADAKPTYSNGNANHLTTKPPNQLNTPLPPAQSEPPSNGVFKNGGFKVERKLTHRGLEAAKSKAPGWDIYHLMQIYDEGIANGNRSPPDKADAAFPVWCEKYTKGKSP